METRKNIILVAPMCDYKNRVMWKHWGTYLSSIFLSMMVTTETYSNYITRDWLKFKSHDYSVVYFCAVKCFDTNIYLLISCWKKLRRWHLDIKKLCTGFVNLIWIYAYEININQKIICISHWHTTSSGMILKCGSAICKFAGGKSVNCKPNNLRVTTRPICRLLSVS